MELGFDLKYIFCNLFLIRYVPTICRDMNSFNFYQYSMHLYIIFSIIILHYGCTLQHMTHSTKILSFHILGRILLAAHIIIGIDPSAYKSKMLFIAPITVVK